MLHDPNTGIPILLGSRFAEFSHLAAIRMSLSKTPRSREEDVHSFSQFVKNLRESSNVCANVIESEENRITTRERWTESREAITRAEWVAARAIEDSRLEYIRSVVDDEGLEL